MPPVNEVDERELIAGVLRKDRKATAEFVSRHADRVYSYVRHRLIPRADMVEDLVQEIFLAALKGLPGFRGDNLADWLIGIARNKVSDFYRSRLREPLALLESEEQPELQVESHIEQLIDRARIEEKAAGVLRLLPEAYSVVLLWRYWEKKSAFEMAAETGKSVKAVERTLARARAEFKRRWQDA